MKYYTLSLLALVASLTPPVMGHGWVASIVIDGAVHQGNNPFQPENAVASPIRLVNSSSPVRNVQDPFISCGLEAKSALQIADAKAGSIIQFNWINDIPDKRVRVLSSSTKLFTEQKIVDSYYRSCHYIYGEMRNFLRSI